MRPQQGNHASGQVAIPNELRLWRWVGQHIGHAHGFKHGRRWCRLMCRFQQGAQCFHAFALRQVVCIKVARRTIGHVGHSSVNRVRYLFSVRFFTSIRHQHKAGGFISFAQVSGNTGNPSPAKANHGRGSGCLPACPRSTDALADIGHTTGHQFTHSEPALHACAGQVQFTGPAFGFQSLSSIGRRYELQAR